MKLLALETTDATGSVAIFEDGRLVLYAPLPKTQRSAQSLAPAIKRLLDDATTPPRCVDVVAVAVGPGSFTGLRVGIATAKAFAWAVGARVVGVDSLDAIAFELDAVALDLATSPSGRAIVSLGIDAQRGDAAVRDYLFERDAAGARTRPRRLFDEYRVLSHDAWFDVASRSTSASSREALPVFFGGSALARVKNLSTRLQPGVVLTEQTWRPTAVGVGRVGSLRAGAEDFDDVWRLLPSYSRRAAAEEKALERERAGETR